MSLFDYHVVEGRVTAVAGGLIVGSGIVFLGVALWHLTLESWDVVELALGGVLPAALAVIMIGGGYHLTTSGLSDSYAVRLTFWWLAGGTVAALMAVVMILYQRSHGVVVVDALFAVVNNTIAGGIGGLLVGYYNIQTQQQAEKLQNQADALEEERSRVARHREQLELLNRIVRHDIRNDLNVIQGMAELAEDHIDEDGADYLATVQRAANDGINLTATARDFVQALNDDTDPDLQPVALTELLQDQIQRTRQAYPEAVIQSDGLPETDVEVQADEMLSSVFRNLLVNAVQHNDKETPHVTVALDETATTVVVSIADNGPGIPDARKDQVFGRGKQGLESSGTGIGLYLVDQLVTQYGGDVWIEDHDPEGSIFKVRLHTA